MPAMLLALLLLTASVDPRLEEPLRLLAELHDGEGQPIGEAYVSLPEQLGLTLVVGPLPDGAGGYYDVESRTLIIAEALMDEDPRVVAAGLAHELQHANDFDAIANGLLEADCVELEARGFEAQVQITRALWPDELPTGSRWELDLTANTMNYEAGGLDRIRELLEANPGYRERCGMS